MTLIAGQPCDAEFVFVDAEGLEYDPPKVVLSSVAPFGSVAPYTVGTDANAVKTAVGHYTLTFTPDTDGPWVAVGDALDLTGKPLGAGISVELDVAPRLGGSVAWREAVAIVSQFLRRPLTTVNDRTIRVWSGEEGVLELPGRPIVNVTHVVDVLTGTEVLPVPGWYGTKVADPGVRAFSWYDVTYSYGWADQDVPQIVRAVIIAVSARIAANPDGVKMEMVGTYRVDYGIGGRWLTDDERDVLREFRPSTATLNMRPPKAGVP